LGAKILSQVAQGKEIQAVAGKFRASRRFFPQPASFVSTVSHSIGGISSAIALVAGAVSKTKEAANILVK
jgi:hypothetical protein